jgi:hypothetical protein
MTRFQVDHGSLAYPNASHIDDAATGRTVAIFPSPDDMAADHPYAVTQARRAEFLADTLNRVPRFRVGDRVRFIREVEECFPSDPVPVGATGTIRHIERGYPDYIAVRLDDPILVAMFAEWDGCVWIHGEPLDRSLEQAAAETFEHTDDPAAAYLLNGEPVDLLAFLDANLDPIDGTWDAMLAECAIALEPGESVTFGGGAAAVSRLTRVS